VFVSFQAKHEHCAERLAADWEVASGFRIDVHAEGFRLPTALAFVPNPGPAPADPLYFVTELDGRVKVVTNDRSVHTFAEGFAAFARPGGPPINMGENGTAGICLEPGHGYVFVTFVYRDSSGSLRNNVIRFDTTPRRFSVQPHSNRVFTEVFARDVSSDSHQIGSCQVYQDLLYVSVGDGHQTALSQDLRVTLGKILRMTLDGRPAFGNPFVNGDSLSAERFVWAYGFRNPFGLRIVRGRVFVTENGEGLDRFSEVHEGVNYMWDGRDWSIGLNGAAVFGPAVSPVQPDYLPPQSAVYPPEFRGQFFVPFAGGTGERGPGLGGEKSIVMLDYDFSRERMRQVPRQFVRYRGSGYGTIVAMSFGPDGLYFAPLFPGATGQSPVFRIVQAPERQHPFVLGGTRDPRIIIAEKGCLGCHRLEGRGGNAGPPLESPGLRTRLLERLNAEQYSRSLAAVDSLPGEPFRAFAAARREVASARGLDRVRVWIKHRLLEPRFDSPDARMPSLGLSESQATIVANYLAGRGEPEGRIERLRAVVRGHLPVPRYRHIASAFLLGLAVPLVLRRARRR
jgi:glucose/arabinose dehydrogenase